MLQFWSVIVCPRTISSFFVCLRLFVFFSAECVQYDVAVWARGFRNNIPKRTPHRGHGWCRHTQIASAPILSALGLRAEGWRKAEWKIPASAKSAWGERQKVWAPRILNSANFDICSRKLWVRSTINLVWLGNILSIFSVLYGAMIYWSA